MEHVHSIRLRIQDHGFTQGLAGVTARVSALMERLPEHWRHLRCALTGGHHRVLHAEPTRLALKCVACGHTTHGWEVGGLELAARYADPGRGLRR